MGETLSQGTAKELSHGGKDVDFDRLQVTVRGGKGDKDRSTMLAECLIEPMRQHLTSIHDVWIEDRQQGVAVVWLPAEALARKYPKAGEEWP